MRQKTRHRKSKTPTKYPPPHLPTIKEEDDVFLNTNADTMTVDDFLDAIKNVKELTKDEAKDDTSTQTTQTEATTTTTQTMITTTTNGDFVFMRDYPRSLGVYSTEMNSYLNQAMLNFTQMCEFDPCRNYIQNNFLLLMSLFCSTRIVQDVYRDYAYNMAFAVMTGLVDYTDDFDRKKIYTYCVNHVRTIFGQPPTETLDSIDSAFQEYLSTQTVTDNLSGNLIKLSKAPTLKRSLLCELMDKKPIMNRSDYPLVVYERVRDGKTWVDEVSLKTFMIKYKIDPRVKIGHNMSHGLVSILNKIRLCWILHILSEDQIVACINNCSVKGELQIRELLNIIRQVLLHHYDFHLNMDNMIKLCCPHTKSVTTSSSKKRK